MAPLKILVVGATGQQGHATIAALESSTQAAPPIHILALTRSPTSPKAQALKTQFPGISLVHGDPAHPEPILATHSTITSIFLVTVPPNDEHQALPVINAAVAHGIPHIVFSSVDRGGETRSHTNPTTVPQFAAKHRVELHLRKVTEGTQTDWTILRPAGFMDNYAPGLFGSMMAGLWATMPADRKMQLVSVKDIGVMAAMALLERQAWKGRAVGIAGDELTFAEADEVFRSVVGSGMPRLWNVPSLALRWGVEDARMSMEWFERVGFGVDINTLRREGIKVQRFGEWVRESGHLP